MVGFLNGFIIINLNVCVNFHAFNKHFAAVAVEGGRQMNCWFFNDFTLRKTDFQHFLTKIFKKKQ